MQRGRALIQWRALILKWFIDVADLKAAIDIMSFCYCVYAQKCEDMKDEYNYLLNNTFHIGRLL